LGLTSDDEAEPEEAIEAAKGMLLETALPSRPPRGLPRREDLGGVLLPRKRTTAGVATAPEGGPPLFTSPRPDAELSNENMITIDTKAAI